MSKPVSKKVSLPADFDGTVRLFPLPNVVLFPQVLQALHIYEERYRAMTAEAIRTDRLIAMAMLRPGWESDYEGRPPIFSTACLGRIVSQQKLPDGRYYLLLQGISRVRILYEHDDAKPFRTAKVQLQEEVGACTSTQERFMHHQVLEALWRFCPAIAGVQPQYPKLVQADVPLGVLTDGLSYGLPLKAYEKQEFLEELDVVRRAEKLIACIDLLRERLEAGQELAVAQWQKEPFASPIWAMALNDPNFPWREFLNGFGDSWPEDELSPQNILRRYPIRPSEN